MISVFAFKLSIIYLVPYIYMTIHPRFTDVDNMGMTTSYISINDVVSVSEIYVEVNNMRFTTKLVSNRTHSFVLVDLPSAVDLCALLMVHAPEAPCKRGDIAMARDFTSSLNPKFIQRAFGVPNFNYLDKASMALLLSSSTYDYPFMVQSFPSLAVKLQSPVLIRESAECGATNCSVPRVTDFFWDVGVNTAVYGAVHASVKYVVRPYVTPYLSARLGPYVTPVTSYIKRPFIEWYNRALYAADSMSARSFEAGAAAFPENIALSSIPTQLDNLIVEHSFKGPLVSQSSLVNNVGSSVSLGSDLSASAFRSPVGSGSLASTASGALPGIIASSRDAGTAGIIKSTGAMRYYSAPSLPTLGRGTEALMTLSRAPVSTLTRVPVSILTTGEATSVHIIRSNSRSALSLLSSLARKVPKRRKRQAGVISRRIAQGIRATGNLLKRVPAWVGHAVGLSVPWVFAGVEHLTTFDETITTIYPIQRLATYERYFIAMYTLLLAQCFHDDDIRTTVIARYSDNDTIQIGRRTFTPADVVFDIRRGVAGDTIRECTHLLDGQVQGMSRDLLLESISVHFDTTYVLEDVVMYNGPAKYIINDYVAYFNDIFPAFSPYTRHHLTNSRFLERVENYNNDFERSKRSHARTKRGSYTRTGRVTTGPVINFNSGSSFTSGVQNLLDTPRLRYEFDILQSTHYNTSFSYYHSLRSYASSSSINFNDASSHSGFRILEGITVIEVLRGINPFDVYIPRLNIVRELISGYNMEYDLRRLRETATSVSTQLEYADLPTLVGLFYLLQFPTDINGFRKISGKSVTPEVMSKVGSYLYRNRYARVPILIVLQKEEYLASLRDMFVIHVRSMNDILSWKHYSPIMLTTSLALIPSGAYTICISKTKSHTSKLSLFGETTADLGEDGIFFDACDLASIHVTFDNSIQEIIENEFMPDRVKSLLSTTSRKDYELPSGGLYDPILSELIDKVEPSHRAELDSRVRGSWDEGSEIRPGVHTEVRTTSEATTSRAGVTTVPTTEKSLTNTLVKESPIKLRLISDKEEDRVPYPGVMILKRNWALLLVLLILMSLLSCAICVMCIKPRRRRERRCERDLRESALSQTLMDKNATTKI